MAKVKKTNAMRILDQKKAKYEVLEYDTGDGKVDGVSVAEKIDLPVNLVYKTLVLQGVSKSHYVCIIPVDKNLNLKAVAKQVNEKKVEMIAVKDILKITGYIRGGCSPLGMKKEFRTIFDESVNNIDQIVLSAGKIGQQIKIDVDVLFKVMKIEIAKIIDKN